MKLLMSSFAGGLKVRNTKQKIKMGEKGVWPRSYDLLLNFGTPYCYNEATNVKVSRLIEADGY